MQAQDSSDETGVVDVDGNSRKSVVAARRRKATAACELALSGATWEEIAEILGYPTARTAKVATEKALEKRFDAEDKVKLRGLAGARLNSLLRSVWDKAHDDDDPEHLAAVGKAREVIADHRKLFGLDAPQEFILTNPNDSQIDAWVAKMVSNQTPDVVEADIVEAELVDEAPAEIEGPDAAQA